VGAGTGARVIEISAQLRVLVPEANAETSRQTLEAALGLGVAAGSGGEGGSGGAYRYQQAISAAIQDAGLFSSSGSGPTNGGVLLSLLGPLPTVFDRSGAVAPPTPVPLAPLRPPLSFGECFTGTSGNVSARVLAQAGCFDSGMTAFSACLDGARGGQCTGATSMVVILAVALTAGLLWLAMKSIIAKSRSSLVSLCSSCPLLQLELSGYFCMVLTSHHNRRAERMAVRAEIALEMWKKKVAQNKIVASTRNLFAQVMHPACVITKQHRSFCR
jgi:hypothetical protein